MSAVEDAVREMRDASAAVKTAADHARSCRKKLTAAERAYAKADERFRVARLALVESALTEEGS